MSMKGNVACDCDSGMTARAALAMRGAARDHAVMTPRFPSRALARLAGLALLLASSACRSDAPHAAAPGSGPVSGPAATATAGGTAALYARIEAARGAAACDTDDQCHTIGVGAKACGGPEQYLAWSSRNDDGTRLRALVAEHSAARRADDMKRGVVSNCAMALDPGATCAAGHCVLRAPATGPGAGAPVAR